MNNKQLLSYLRVAKCALEKSIDLLNDYIIDYPYEKNLCTEWTYTEGGIDAYREMANEYFYRFASEINRLADNSKNVTNEN